MNFSSEQYAHNLSLVKRLLVMVVMMLCFGFAMVPFYRTMCRVAGLNNIDWADLKKLDSMEKDINRIIHMNFDTNVHNDSLLFRPLVSNLSLHPGEIKKVIYEVINLTNHTLSVVAIPSFSPEHTGRYFYKLQCFCFEKQILKPHETKQMPVVFVIDTKLPTQADIITLSYTYFEIGRDL